MGIKKKFFLLLAVSELSIMILSYIVIYQYLYHAMYEEIVNRHQAIVELNQQMANNFLHSFSYTVTQISGDQSVGECLSTDGDDLLEYISNRTILQRQFSHYAAHQSVDNSYTYQNMLFLSDEIPLADYFDTGTLENISYGSTSKILSNAEVKGQEWYQKTVQEITYVFISEDENFCIARRLNNNEYAGPAVSMGQAVMVTSVPLDELDKVFFYTPVTEHSGFFMISPDGEFLFGSNEEIGEKEYLRLLSEEGAEDTGELEASAVTVLGQEYLFSYCETNYGIQLVFLTPEQDIADSIQPMMYNYTWIFAGIFLVSIVIVWVLSRRLTRPLIKLSDTIGGIEDTRLFDKDKLKVSREKELVVLQDSFAKMVDNNNRLIEDIQYQSEQKKRSQLQALQAQINPHFLFNTMDMVNWLALMRGCGDIANIVNSISNLMRYSITDPDGMVPISKEMGNIREFISVYQLRHQNTLHMNEEIESQDIQIPKFTLQPLVENSVRYAKPPEGSELVITVRAWKQGGQSIIEVEDNGIGVDAALLNAHLNYEDSSLKVSSGFGIRNVNERIGLRFQNGSRLSYRNTKAGGLTARIELN